MSDLLVYVNKSISCSLVMENFDVNLEAFRRDILDQQVGDILPPQYKSTRLLKNQRVIIGVKQEAALKLTQCMQKEEDNFAVHLLQEETSNLNLKGNELAESRDGDQGDQDQVQQVPPRKKAKISLQLTLFDLCAPRTSTQQPTPSPFSAARARKVKIFSEQEINESIGMQKSY